MLVFVPFLLLEIGNRNGSTGLMFCLNPPEGFLGLKGTKSTSRCRRASDLGLRFVGDAGGQDKEAAANKGGFRGILEEVPEWLEGNDGVADNDLAIGTGELFEEDGAVAGLLGIDPVVPSSIK